MITLSEIEQDAMVESFNISVGRAAASLSEMLGREVILSIPEIEILRRDEVEKKVGEEGKRDIDGVCQQFSGPFSGRALLLFPAENSLELVRILLREEVDMAFLTEMEEEALLEVGNILLNACLSNFSHLLDHEITTDIPSSLKGSIHEIIMRESEKKNEDYVLLLRMAFVVKEADIAGYIAFLMDIQALDLFRQKLAAYFGYSYEIPSP